MHKSLIAAGAVYAFLGVLIGAFGAHALATTLELHGTRATYETGVQYQLVHALALILLGVLSGREGSAKLDWAGKLMIIGIALFSFSLYVLALTGVRILGAITPFGGLCFLIAWLLIAIWGFEKPQAAS